MDRRSRSEVPPDVEAFCEEQIPCLVGALTLYCGDRAVAEELPQEALGVGGRVVVERGRGFVVLGVVTCAYLGLRTNRLHCMADTNQSGDPPYLIRWSLGVIGGVVTAVLVYAITQGFGGGGNEAPSPGRSR